MKYTASALDPTDPRVVENVADIRTRFATAQPFRHVVIEGFLRNEALERLIAEFPGFDVQHATNEMGHVGGKASRPDLAELGASYRELDRLLQSAPFLQLVEEISGIPTLIYDPDYEGGGTHENLAGQELDPHVDFNYHPRYGWHRRLNLILFLNRDWDASWGGCLDLHKNPWAPNEDEVVSIVPSNNTAVLFETTERSWHGFQRIVLPPGRESLSRRSVAVYYYTKDRPPEQTAPSHATVYVPRPLPPGLEAGKVLNEADLLEIQRLLDRRDQQIRFLYEREQEYMGVMHNVLTSRTFQVAHAVSWPFRALKRFLGKER